MGQALIPLVKANITEEDVEFLSAHLTRADLEGEADVAALEATFAHAVGATGAVATNSGSSALHLALLAVGVGPGGEVILPSYTCVALLHAVAMCGARPVLVDNVCDVGAAEFHAAPEQILEHCTSYTQAIIVSHMFGSLAPMGLLRDLGIPIVEDFTLSLGARQDSVNAGSLGTVGICSLHWSKMISAGQGGMVVSSDPGVLQRVRTLCHYDAPMERWRYLELEQLRGAYSLAYNYRMSELQAVMALSQLQQLPKFIAKRRAFAAYYSRELSHLGILNPHITPDDGNVFFRYMVEAPSAIGALKLFLEDGIQAGRGVYPPLHVLLDLPDSRFPGAVRAITRLVSLPVHPALDDAQVEHVARCARRILAQ